MLQSDSTSSGTTSYLVSVLLSLSFSDCETLEFQLPAKSSVCIVVLVVHMCTCVGPMVVHWGEVLLDFPLYSHRIVFVMLFDYVHSKLHLEHFWSHKRKKHSVCYEAVGGLWWHDDHVAWALWFVFGMVFILFDLPQRMVVRLKLVLLATLCPKWSRWSHQQTCENLPLYWSERGTMSWFYFFFPWSAYVTDCLNPVS